MDEKRILSQIEGYEHRRLEVLKEIEKSMFDTVSNRLKIEVEALTITIDSLYKKFAIAKKLIG